MTDERSHEAVQRVLRLFGERLQDFLEGDDLAFETLGEALEEERFTPEELQASLFLLQSLTVTGGASEASVEGIPGKHAQRVWSDEERESLTPEAWGLLLDLRRRGSLDSEQFERVLDLLTSSVTRPVGVDATREIAARVALSVETIEGPSEDDRGDHETAH
jgi:uncharacterized protein Smg (DUF494 family)